MDESPYMNIENTLMSLSIRPILKTLTTLRRVGETGKSVIMSSMTMPTMEAITSTKSNTFHPAVKYMKRRPMILTMHCLGGKQGVRGKWLLQNLTSDSWTTFSKNSS